jgi:hypothetical protein
MHCRSFSAVVAASLTLLSLCDPALAYNAPLSDTTVREAYFLGQRRDETTARVLDSYTRNLSAPKTGPHVSTVQVFTPFAQVVEFSRQHSLGYSAQQAELDYRERSDAIEVIVYVRLTPTYGAVIPQPARKGSRSGESVAYWLRSPDFWQDFRFQVAQRDSILEPRHLSGAPTYAPGSEGSSCLIGATIALEFAAEDVASDDATVVVDTPDGQHVIANFDLSKLR